jgi:DNA-binding NtrC family response regulator
MSNKLIFVVEEEPALAEVVAAYLEQSGFAVAAFTCPVKALAASASRKPDLLLSDFKMDGMDGLTLATKMTERHPTCKVLIMSGDIHDATTHPARNSFEFLQKPIPMSSLLAKIAEILDGD